jgi:hypothetical protein
MDLRNDRDGRPAFLLARDAVQPCRIEPAGLTPASRRRLTDRCRDCPARPDTPIVPVALKKSIMKLLLAPSLLRFQCFVNAAWTRTPIDSITNPATGELLAHVPRFGKQETGRQSMPCPSSSNRGRSGLLKTGQPL